MGFAERMEGFTKEMLECAHARADVLCEVRANTKQLLTGARSFMTRVSQEHKDRAGQVRATLAENLRELQEQVRTMRHQFLDQVGKMREHLHEMLGEDCRARQVKIAELKSAFEEERTELANDLRKSASIWRGRSHKGPNGELHRGKADFVQDGPQPGHGEDFAATT